MASRTGSDLPVACLGLQSALLFASGAAAMVRPAAFGLSDEPSMPGIPPPHLMVGMTSIALASVFGTNAMVPQAHKPTFVAGVVTRVMAVIIFWPYAPRVAVWEGVWGIFNAICLSHVW